MKSKKVLGWTLGILAVVIAGLAIWIGPLVTTAVRAGFLDKVEDRSYVADIDANLKNVHRALMMYAESEGALPEASGWMDAAWLRLKTADMKEEEAKKILQSSHAKPGEFGLAFNRKLSKIDPAALSNQAAILVYEGADSKWNSSGDPEQDAKPGAKAINLAGEVTVVGGQAASKR